jgi:hypothetical protein
MEKQQSIYNNPSTDTSMGIKTILEKSEVLYNSAITHYLNFGLAHLSSFIKHIIYK